MSVRGGLPPLICSQIQKSPKFDLKGGQHFSNNSEIQNFLNYPGGPNWEFFIYIWWCLSLMKDLLFGCIFQFVYKDHKTTILVLCVSWLIFCGSKTLDSYYFKIEKLWIQAKNPIFVLALDSSIYVWVGKYNIINLKWFNGMAMVFRVQFFLLPHTD